MADNSFGVTELNLIGSSGTPKIESPNNLNLNAVNVAISTNATVGGNLSVSGTLIGDGSGLTGVVGSGSGIAIKHDGAIVGTAGTIDFSTNLDVSAISGAAVTITASGGGGSIAGIDTTGTSFFNQLLVSGITTFSSTVNLGDNDRINFYDLNNTVYGNTNGLIIAASGTRDIEIQCNASGGTSGDIKLKTGSTEVLKVRGNGNLIVEETTSFHGSTVSVSNDLYANGNIIGDNATNISGINSVTATSFFGNLTGSADIATYTSSWAVTENGSSSAYRFSGPGNLSTQNNPTIYLVRGQKYKFNLNASGHPFHIQTVSGAYSLSNLYTTGVTNAGAAVGTIEFDVPMDAPNTLYYVCQNHSSMAGTINIASPPNQIQTLQGSTTSINNDAYEALNIIGYKAYSLFKIATNHDALVRVYVDSASRNADTSRSEGQDPTPGIGLIAEARTSGGTVLVTPGAMGFNNENPRTNIIYVGVTNRSGSQQQIQVTLTAIKIGE